MSHSPAPFLTKPNPAEIDFPVELKVIPLSAIYLPLNYRSSIETEGLDSLAESIRTGGLVQPVAVRPLAGPIEGCSYALVAGFRRFAAHERIEATQILATVRPMSEQQGEILRIVENLQRENPHPADEALAVGQLCQQGMDTEAIAAYLGRNRRWVAQRRAISDLLPAWITALRADRLTLGGAEELARWPQEVQARCLELAGSYSSVGEGSVQQWVRREMQVLSSAPWALGDAALVAAAGACTSCPKRSSCNTVLFAELADKAKDTCLDGKCWETKLSVRLEQVITEQTALAGDKPVVRLSQTYWNPPTGALKMSDFEVVKRKKGTVVGVWVDGVRAAQVVRVQLSASTSQAVAEGKTALTQGQKNRETRHKRLTKEARKRVLAAQAYEHLQADSEPARQGRYAVLVSIVEAQLMPGRSVDLLTLGALAATWGWEKVGRKGPELSTQAYREWVQKQIKKVAPAEAQLLQLLQFAVTHRELSSEWTDYQQSAAALSGYAADEQQVEEATRLLFEAEYDPQTLRARKPASATPAPTAEVLTMPAPESQEPGTQEPESSAMAA